MRITFIFIRTEIVNEIFLKSRKLIYRCLKNQLRIKILKMASEDTSLNLKGEKQQANVNLEYFLIMETQKEITALDFP